MSKQMYIFIALGIILVLLLIYYFYLLPSTGLIPFVDLDTSNQPLSLVSLPVINSTNYTYSMWINVNTWINNNQKYLVYRGSSNGYGAISDGNTIYPSNDSTPGYKHPYEFLLRLDDNNSTLYCSFGTSDSAGSSFKEYILTSNFPIQKWVCIAISLDGMNLDFYMNGKITYSTKMNYLPVAPSNDINFGNPKTGNNYIKNDIFIANFNILNYPFDPNTAMSYYNAGSGQSNSPSNDNKAKLSILRNNTPSASITLF